jgi:hypothetical protein
VVELEQVGQRLGLVLLLLEVGDQRQLTVEQRLVPPGEVDEQFRDRLSLSRLGLDCRQLRLRQVGCQPRTAVLFDLGVLPEDGHTHAGRQHRHAVDARPQPRLVLRRVVVVDVARIEHTAHTVGDNREQRVPEERHPVLVQHDEADQDEEVEVRLDRTLGEVDEQVGAEHQPEGDEERGEAPVARQPGKHEGDGRRRHLQHHVTGVVAVPQPEREQRRDVQPQNPAHQQVPPAERLVVQRVAARQVLEHRVNGAADRSPPAAVVGRRRPEMHGRALGVAAVSASVGVGGTSGTRAVAVAPASCWTSRIAPDPILHRVPILNTTGGRNPIRKHVPRSPRRVGS